MSLHSFLVGVEEKIASWIGPAETFIETEAHLAWGYVHPFIVALEPSAWAAAVPIIVEAVQDIGNGDFADLETNVLNRAEALGVTVFRELDSAVVQAIIAMVKAFHLPGS